MLYPLQKNWKIGLWPTPKQKDCNNSTFYFILSIWMQIKMNTKNVFSSLDSVSWSINTLTLKSYITITSSCLDRLVKCFEIISFKGPLPLLLQRTVSVSYWMISISRTREQEQKAAKWLWLPTGSQATDKLPKGTLVHNWLKANKLTLNMTNFFMLLGSNYSHRIPDTWN